MVVDEAAPWTSGARRYAGWIPNVRSHLSFSMIAAARGAVTVSAPTDGGRKRMVVVLQRRVINDFPLPRFLIERLVTGVAVNWLLVGRTAPVDLPVLGADPIRLERDRQGMLRGRIQMLPAQETRRKRREQARGFASMTNAIDECRRAASAGGPAGSAKLEGLDQLLQGEVEGGGPAVTLEIALLRTGECHIWYAAEALVLPDDDLDLVARQAYYFVKDVVHAHTHHDPSSDQITPLVLDEDRADEPGHSHEIAWRRETLWSLSREVERLNREGGLTNQRRSLGIIAYAEAFQSALMGHVRDPDADVGFTRGTVLHDYDFKHLKDSIKAEIDVAATKVSQRLQMATAAVATTISVTALVSSLVGTHNGSLAKVRVGVAPGTHDVGWLAGQLPWMAWNPLLTGIFASVVLLVIMSITVFDRRAGIYNAAQRVISQFARALAGSFSDSPPRQFAVDLLVHLATFVGAVCLVLLGLRLIFV